MSDIKHNKIHTLEVKTIEEVMAQLKILLDNNYVVAVVKNDNLLGCVNYTINYEKKKSHVDLG